MFCKNLYMSTPFIGGIESHDSETDQLMLDKEGGSKDLTPLCTKIKNKFITGRNGKWTNNKFVMWSSIHIISWVYIKINTN